MTSDAENTTLAGTPTPGRCTRYGTVFLCLVIGWTVLTASRESVACHVLLYPAALVWLLTATIIDRHWNVRLPGARWSRVATVVNLATACLWLGTDLNQVRLADYPTDTRAAIAKRHGLNEDLANSGIVVMTGFPLRDVVILRAESYPLPRGPGNPNLPNACETAETGWYSLSGANLNCYWLNLVILTSAAAVVVTFLRVRWLVRALLASLLLAMAASAIQIWVLIDPYALLS